MMDQQILHMQVEREGARQFLESHFIQVWFSPLPCVGPTISSRQANLLAIDKRSEKSGKLLPQSDFRNNMIVK